MPTVDKSLLLHFAFSVSSVSFVYCILICILYSFFVALIVTFFFFNSSLILALHVCLFICHLWLSPIFVWHFHISVQDPSNPDVIC